MNGPVRGTETVHGGTVPAIPTGGAVDEVTVQPKLLISSPRKPFLAGRTW
jgi:hypothetical protein